jgi:hypothetical protein
MEAQFPCHWPRHSGQYYKKPNLTAEAAEKDLRGEISICACLPSESLRMQRKSSPVPGISGNIPFAVKRSM